MNSIRWCMFAILTACATTVSAPKTASDLPTPIQVFEFPEATVSYAASFIVIGPDRIVDEPENLKHEEYALLKNGILHYDYMFEASGLTSGHKATMRRAAMVFLRSSLFRGDDSIDIKSLPQQFTRVESNTGHCLGSFDRCPDGVAMMEVTWLYLGRLASMAYHLVADSSDSMAAYCGEEIQTGEVVDGSIHRPLTLDAANALAENRYVRVDDVLAAEELLYRYARVRAKCSRPDDGDPETIRKDGNTLLAKLTGWPAK